MNPELFSAQSSHPHLEHMSHTVEQLESRIDRATRILQDIILSGTPNISDIESVILILND